MATSFNKKYTELSTINSGNQIQDGDVIKGEYPTKALQNTAHFKELTNNMVVRNAVIQNKKLILTLASKGNNDENATVTTLEFGVTDINAVAMVKSMYINGNDWEVSIVNSPSNDPKIVLETGYIYHDPQDPDNDEVRNRKIELTLDGFKSTTYYSQGSTTGGRTWSLETHPYCIRIKNNPDSVTAIFAFRGFFTISIPNGVSSMAELAYYLPDGEVFAVNGIYRFTDNRIVAGMKLDKTANKAKIIYFDSDNDLVETSLWISYTDFVVESYTNNF